MAVQISEVRYKNFGRCLKIENAFVELLVTLDVGPRVIRYAIRGGTNVFFEDKTRQFQHDEKAMMDYYGRGACWYIYGGHRIWTSPEYMPQTYFPDNNRVRYAVEGTTVTFTPPPQRKNGIQMELSLTLEEYGTHVRAVHRVTNAGDAPKTFAVWCLSVLAPGGIEIVPFNRHNTGFLGNRLMALWPYTDMGDRRVSWGAEYFTLRQDKFAAKAFKVGADNRRGWAAYALRDVLFVKEFEHIDGAVYPDGGMSFETYTNNAFLEMETLSPMTEVEPGGTLTQTEQWSLIDGVRPPKPADWTGIAGLVAKFIDK